MGPDLPALGRLHDALKEGAENSGRDSAPVEATAHQETTAHVPIEVGELQGFGKEIAVHVRQFSEFFQQILLPAIRRRVEHLKQASQLDAEVRTVGASMVFYEESEGVALEKAGVLGEQAEE